MARPKKTAFTLRGGYSGVSLSVDDLKRIDPEYNGKGLEWTKEEPTVSLPATTSDAILAELNSQHGLVAGEATAEE